MKRKKFSIFTSATMPYGLRMKAAIACRRHGRNRPHEKSEQQIFQPAKRNIDPARQLKIPAEYLPAQAATNIPRCVPTGHSQLQKALRNRNAIASKRHQQKHRRRMQSGHASASAGSTSGSSCRRWAASPRRQRVARHRPTALRSRSAAPRGRTEPPSQTFIRRKANW